MEFRRPLSALAFALPFASFAACAVPQPDSLALAQAACARGAQYDEVLATGRIRRVLGIRNSRSGAHEGFIIEVAGQPVLVEDNVDITGVIPLRRGESVQLQGQYECDDGVMHWTHHDPSGRHLTGFVKADGRTYQ
jgi:Protein of unknown function (DUF3465)